MTVIPIPYESPDSVILTEPTQFVRSSEMIPENAPDDASKWKFWQNRYVKFWIYLNERVRRGILCTPASSLKYI